MIYDVDPALGGPIKKDVLWFFGSVRVWKTDQNIAGQFYNLNPPGSHVYTPDLSRPAYEGDRDGNQSLRLTWRASPKNKSAPNSRTTSRFAITSTARAPPTGCWRPTRSSTTTRGRRISGRSAGTRR